MFLVTSVTYCKIRYRYRQMPEERGGRCETKTDQKTGKSGQNRMEREGMMGWMERYEAGGRPHAPPQEKKKIEQSRTEQDSKEQQLKRLNYD